MFNVAKRKAVSGVIKDMGQVFFASAFIDPIVRGETANWLLVVMGLLLAAAAWFISISLAKE